MRHLIAVNLLLLSLLRLFAAPARDTANLLLDLELASMCKKQPRLKARIDTAQVIGGAAVLLGFAALFSSPIGQAAVETGPLEVALLLFAYVIVATIGQVILTGAAVATVAAAKGVRRAWQRALATADEKLDRAPEKKIIS